MWASSNLSFSGRAVWRAPGPYDKWEQSLSCTPRATVLDTVAQVWWHSGSKARRWCSHCSEVCCQSLGGVCVWSIPLSTERYPIICYAVMTKFWLAVWHLVYETLPRCLVIDVLELVELLSPSQKNELFLDQTISRLTLWWHGAFVPCERWARVSTGLQLWCAAARWQPALCSNPCSLSVPLLFQGRCSQNRFHERLEFLDLIVTLDLRSCCNRVQLLV